VVDQINLLSLCQIFKSPHYTPLSGASKLVSKYFHRVLVHLFQSTNLVDWIKLIAAYQIVLILTGQG